MTHARLVLLTGCLAVAHAQFSRAYMRDEFITHTKDEPPMPLTSEWMMKLSAANSTLLEYLYPPNATTAFKEGDIRKAWRPMTKGCKIVPAGCYCFHVTGSPEKALRPADSWRTSRDFEAAQLMKANLWRTLPASVEQLAAESCSCVAPWQLMARAAAKGAGGRVRTDADCLCGDMRPGKLLAIISACRAAGVTHIIEEGRYGGLSALVYALHGFRVTSVEMAPIDFVEASLRSMAPQIAIVNGDGSQLVPKLVTDAPPAERIAVIFDGEKRKQAYKTYRKIAGRTHLAVFDDTDHQRFALLLKQYKETAWHTWDLAYARAHNDGLYTQPFEEHLRKIASKWLAKELPRRGLNKMPDPPSTRERLQVERNGSSIPAVGELKPLWQLVDEAGRLSLPPGGLQQLASYQSTLLMGGAWKREAKGGGKV